MAAQAAHSKQRLALHQRLAPATGGGATWGRLFRSFLAVLLLCAGVASAAGAQGPEASMSGANGGWWHQASLFVINPWATIALLVAGCLLLFHDLLTPFDWGVTGTLGVLFVGLVFAAHITERSEGWIGVVLALGGLTLLLLETHVFPGHGLAAIGGLLLLFLGMFWALGGSHNTAFALSLSVVLTLVALVAFFAYLPKSPVWKKLGQEMRQKAAAGTIAGDSRQHLLNRAGKSLTHLRPSGVADFHGERVDVVTEGDFLDAGTPLTVVKVEGLRVVVEPATAGAAETSAPASKQMV